MKREINTCTPANAEIATAVSHMWSEQLRCCSPVRNRTFPASRRSLRYLFALASDVYAILPIRAFIYPSTINICPRPNPPLLSASSSSFCFRALKESHSPYKVLIKSSFTSATKAWHVCPSWAILDWLNLNSGGQHTRKVDRSLYLCPLNWWGWIRGRKYRTS